MIVTKRYLPRRTVLRGLGATVALPFLDAMAPALTAVAKTAAQPIPRMGFFYVPNGMFLPSFHPAGEGGANFELTPTLKPLEPHRDKIVVVSGLSNSGVVSTNEGGGVHTRAHGGWLSGVLPKRTEGADLRAGKTIDQYVADKLGADTALRSLELTIDSNYQVGNCENGYSCAYINSSSWLNATTPLPHERDPRVIFRRLFGDGGSVEARLEQMQTDRSILDSVSDSLGKLERRLGLGDRTTVDEYLDSVREIERRIQRAEAHNATTPLPEVEQPAGVPDDYEEHVKLMHDLLVLGYQADVTRVSCMQMARRAERPVLSAHRRAGRAPHGVAPPVGPAQHYAVHQDQHVPHDVVRPAPRSDEPDTGRRRHVAGSQHPVVGRRNGRRRPPHAVRPADYPGRRRLRDAAGRAAPEVRAAHPVHEPRGEPARKGRDAGGRHLRQHGSARGPVGATT